MTQAALRRMYMENIKDLSADPFICTHSLVISPLGPVGVANFGSIPWVSRICLAAGLRRSLDKEDRVRHNFTIVVP